MPLAQRENLKPASVRARQSFAGLRQLQRKTAAAIFRPLARGNRMRRTWTDGRPMKEVAAQFIKPNDRLSSFERLEIYNRQYWFRLLDCLYDDYPGLRAILGDRKFHNLRVAYLARYPSRSFTLRNLGSRLEQFLLEEPRWIWPRQQMCLDMARFEWAQVVGFDGPALPALTADDLLGRSPSKLRLGIQPYLTLLRMDYPLDDFVLALKKHNASLRSEASNAMEGRHRERITRRPRLPRPRETYLAVHRFNNELYYKRLTREQYRLLAALRDGQTLKRACASAMPESDEAIEPQHIREWFQTWMELGWFCRRR